MKAYRLKIKPDFMEILMDFSMKDLRNFAKENRLMGISALKKADLAEHLKEWILQPENFAGNLYSLNDIEIAAFESLIEREDEYVMQEEDEHIFAKLLEKGYLALRYDDVLDVPAEVAEAYQLIDTQEFHLKRKRLNWIFDCCFFAESFYGITPLDVLIKLVNLHKEYKVTKDSLRTELQEITSFYKYFVLQKNDEIWTVPLTKNDTLCRNLKAMQDDKEFYIPSYDELIDFIENGYFSREKYTRGFIRLLEVSFKMENENATNVAAKIQAMIASGCRLQDIAVFMEDEDIIFTSEADISKTMACIHQMWNNTRMVWNRGFTPLELSVKEI